MSYPVSLREFIARRPQGFGSELPLMMCEDKGSIIPLGLGVIATTAAIALLFTELIGVQYQTLQNKQLADVIVLKVANDLQGDGITPVTNLEYRPVVNELLSVASAHMRVRVSDVSVISRDGKTLEALVCSEWVSFTGLNLGLFGKICASTKARSISNGAQ